jgi:hypothetical protein
MGGSNDAVESALEALKRHAAAVAAFKEALAAEIAKIRIEDWRRD